MSEPSPDDVKYALEQFGEDAKLWDDNGKELRLAKDGAEALSIDAAAFGPAAWMGLSERYHDVQQMIVDRLLEGSREFESISRALIKARDDYQRDEDAGVHEINRVG